MFPCSNFQKTSLSSQCPLLLLLFPASVCCLCSSCLFKASPSDKAQSALIGQLARSVVIGQPLPACVGNVGLALTLLGFIKGRVGLELQLNQRFSRQFQIEHMDANNSVFEKSLSCRNSTVLRSLQVSLSQATIHKKTILSSSRQHNRKDTTKK